MGFFSRMAGKSSLVNIKYDLDNLRKVFPNPNASSKYIFLLLENMILAKQNDVSDGDISKCLSEKLQEAPEDLEALVQSVFAIVKSALQDQPEQRNKAERQFYQKFQEATGAPLDESQISTLGKIAMKGNK